MPNELDKNLQSLFREMNSDLPEEPFCGDLLKRIQREQARRNAGRWLMLIFLLAVCAVLSPYLLAGVALMCEGLDWFFMTAEGFLTTMKGMITAAVVALPFAIWKRRWIYRAF